MKSLIKLVLSAATFAILLSSCLNSEKEKTATNDIPETFQDQSIFEEISYNKRGRTSLTDKLFNEILEKDKVLKELYDKIKKIAKENYERNTEINKFLSDNESYYNEVLTYSTSIQDSMLRDKVIASINSSEEYYNEKVINLISLKDGLNRKVAVLNDYKTALKIILTKKSIKSYQGNFKQDTVGLKELINKYDSLIKAVNNKIEE
ncbi:MAG: hypothetical protein L3J35_07275 [Bacteroidales bacterium]|nr:hypothetical protein [Bacteroidales bacterium]